MRCIEEVLRLRQPASKLSYLGKRSEPRENTPAPRGFAARSRVIARLVSLAQIVELARRLRLRLRSQCCCLTYRWSTQKNKAIIIYGLGADYVPPSLPVDVQATVDTIIVARHKIRCCDLQSMQ